MSAIENEATEATPVATPVAAATVETVNLTDLPDARIEDADAFRVTLAEAIRAGARSATEAARAYGATDRFARYIPLLRSAIVKPDGFPDWAGNTDAYSLVVQRFVTEALSGLGQNAARRQWSSVRTQATRVHTLPTIVGYALAGTPHLEDEAALFATDPEKVLTSPSKALIAEVQRQYASTKTSSRAAMRPPKGPFALPEGPKGGKVSGDPDSAVEVLTDAIEGLGDIAPGLTALLPLLRGMSLVTVALGDARLKEIESRESCVIALDRIATLASVTSALIGKHSEQVTDDMVAAFDAALFNPKTDGKTK